jgi:hypothetical protein
VKQTELSMSFELLVGTVCHGAYQDLVMYKSLKLSLGQSTDRLWPRQGQIVDSAAAGDPQPALIWLQTFCCLGDNHTGLLSSGKSRTWA